MTKENPKIRAKPDPEEEQDIIAVYEARIKDLKETHQKEILAWSEANKKLTQKVEGLQYENQSKRDKVYRAEEAIRKYDELKLNFEEHIAERVAEQERTSSHQKWRRFFSALTELSFLLISIFMVLYPIRLVVKWRMDPTWLTMSIVGMLIVYGLYRNTKDGDSR
jgi:uncharacterized membrane protein YcjF (UPF0283 family)